MYFNAFNTVLFRFLPLCLENHNFSSDFSGFHAFFLSSATVLGRGIQEM